MRTTPLVSVRVLTYNHRPYIERCLDGVLGQKVTFPMELVIAEDCSTDGTREIVFDYQRRFPDCIEVVTSDANVGGWENVRRSRERCRGKYLALLDGDDYWTDPCKLEKQIQFLEAHPEYGVIHTDADTYNIKTGLTIQRVHHSSGRTFPEENVFIHLLRSDYPIITATAIYRTSLLADFDVAESSGFISGDTFAWLTFSQRTKFKYLDESTTVHQILEESVTKSRDVQKLAAFRQSGYELYLHFMNKFGCDEETKRIVHRNSNKVLLHLAALSGNKDLADASYQNLIAFCGRNSLTPKDHLSYYSTRNFLFSGLYRLLRRLTRFIGKFGRHR